MGIGPTVSSLARRHSTGEPRPRCGYYAIVCVKIHQDIRLPGRLMAGQRVLAPFIMVRIHAGQQINFLRLYRFLGKKGKRRGRLR